MKPAITMDEIDAMVSEIARNPEAGADRFRALKMLKEQGNLSANAPPALTADEMVFKLSKLMLPAGEALCQVAFRRAFPNRGKPRDINATPDLAAEDLSPEIQETIRKITSIRKLRQVFPNIPRKGFLRGYPARKGIEAQLGWIRLAATKLFVDQENSRIEPRPHQGIDDLTAKAQTEDEPKRQDPDRDGADQVLGPGTGDAVAGGVLP